MPFAGAGSVTLTGERSGVGVVSFSGVGRVRFTAGAVVLARGRVSFKATGAVLLRDRSVPFVNGAVPFKTTVLLLIIVAVPF